MTGPHIEELTDAHFESEVLKSDEPMVVEFSADWSEPCRRCHAIFESLIDDFHPDVRATHIDVADNPQTASNYGVTNLPTYLLFHNGEVAARLCGAVPRAKLRALLERAVDTA